MKISSPCQAAKWVIRFIQIGVALELKDTQSNTDIHMKSSVGFRLSNKIVFFDFPVIVTSSHLAEKGWPL